MEKIVGGIVIVIAVFVGMTLLVTIPVMLLWNAVIPDIFGLPLIGFWQALGLSTLCGLLFTRQAPNSSK